MDNKDLFFAVAEIDEKWIEESETKIKKHLPFKYLVPLATCLTIAVTVAAVYNGADKKTPIQSENSKNDTNNAMIVTNKTSEKQSETTGENKNKADSDTEKKDVPKTNPDTTSNGKKFNESGNGFCQPIGGADSLEYRTVIFKADDGIPVRAYSVASPKDGEVYLSPGLEETMKNHKDEDVQYRVVIEPSKNGRFLTEDDLKTEADRLFKWCQANGYEDCTFSTSKYTYNDGQQSEIMLFGDIVTAEFINNFPADEYGYWIRFENELL